MEMPYKYVKHNWNTPCIKTCLPTKCIVINISFSCCIPLELWTVFMGYTCKSSIRITGKKVRIMSNSKYLAHSEPLFKTLKLLEIGDVGLYKLKLMKFYYNVSYNLLLSYFNYYLEVINNAFLCQYELQQIACPLICPQRTRLVFTESNVLFQFIQLLNYTHTHYQ